MSAPTASNNGSSDGLRQQLVEKLRSDGMLRDLAVERALRTVPRHLFLPGVALEQAYSDSAIPTHEAQRTPKASQNPRLTPFFLLLWDGCD